NARSKALGERAVWAVAPSAIMFRPAGVFGPEDDIFNNLASLARFSPIVPLIGGGATPFPPGFVGGVAEAIARGVDGQVKKGLIYELGGPDVWTLKELMQFVLATIERRRLLVPLPFPVAEFQAWFLQFLPKPPLTPDQVRLLQADNVVSQQAEDEGRTLQGLGIIEPRAIAAIVPSYLWRFRKTGQFR